MNSDIEDALRAEFNSRTRQLPIRHDPYADLARRIARRRRTGLAAGAALLLVAAAGTGLALRPQQDVTAVADTTVSGGCGATPLHRGNAPAWTAPAYAPPDLPYVVSAEGNVVGFLFTQPLRAGTPKELQNKILWLIKDGTGKPLTISARPLHAAAPVVHHEEPGIGGIGYPSITDVPTAGCWRLTLDSNGSSATVDLLYVTDPGR